MRVRQPSLISRSSRGHASCTDALITAAVLAVVAASVPLPPLGTLRLDPNALLPLPSFVIPQPAGVGSISFTVPNVPALVGAPVYTQALLVQDPFQAWLTNATADVIID